MTLTFKEKYQAILEKDSTYEGLFITAVKTTGIFCRPVCTARKPRIENVEFFDSPQEAIEQGYRPCKVCKPLENSGELPHELMVLIRQISDNPDIKVKDKDLRFYGLEPSNVRRLFKKTYGMTFQDYQRKIRLNTAHSNLNSGKSVTQTAYDTGYESLSGFNDSFRKVFGATPSDAVNKEIIHTLRITTPLGPMIACATDREVCLLEFSDRKDLTNYIKKLSSSLQVVPLPGTNHHLDQLQQQLKDYFQGRRKKFNLKLHTSGTDFQNRVWRALMEIPFGETRSYLQQAQSIGRPESVRAVASANGLNRIAIVIPCHRVIGKDGNLRGYAGGINRKKWLLEFEKQHH